VKNHTSVVQLKKHILVSQSLGRVRNYTNTERKCRNLRPKLDKEEAYCPNGGAK